MTEKTIDEKKIKEKILEYIGFDSPTSPYQLIDKILPTLKMKKIPSNRRLINKLINELIKEKRIYIYEPENYKR